MLAEQGFFITKLVGQYHRVQIFLKNIAIAAIERVDRLREISEAHEAGGLNRSGKFQRQ